MATATLFSTSACSLADVFAWMSDNGMSSPIDITSNVHKTYFESGDGSKETPYVIANPLQLYYFAWLQNLGLFNVDGDDADTDIDTVYFTLANDIDMTEYQPLPSVGTTEYPFLGNFDGNGKTISNLTVENEREHLFEPPVGSEEIEKYAEIIGFFGVVGSLPQDELPDDKKYTYTSSTNEIKNLLIKDITIATHTNNALVGFVAGYANGIIDCVGVVGGTIKMVNTPNPTTYTTNISDYTLIGYCTTNCKNEVYVFGSTLSNPGNVALYTVVLNNSNDGEGQGWGGSVKMTDIHNWLHGAAQDSNEAGGYILERTDVVTIGNKTVTTDRSNTVSKRSFSIDGFGSFVGTIMEGSPAVNFVGGGQKVTEYAYEYSDEDVSVYYITDGTNYLNFYGDEITSNIEGSNTKWYASEGTNGGALYTVVDNTVYYLTTTGDNVSVLQDVNADPGNLPTWENVGNGYTLNNQRLIFNNGNWTLDSSFKIYYRNNNTNYYLTNNGTNDVQAVQNDNQAVTWTMTAVNGGYQISTVINNTTYYLAYTQSGNGWWNTNVTGPTLSQNASTWQYENGQFYVSVTSGFGGGTTNYYLRYNNNNDWTIENNTGNSQLSFAYSTDSNVEIISSGTTQKAINFTQREYIDTSLQNGYFDEDGERQTSGFAGISYFPLSFNSSNNTINANNTGYIIGSEWDETTESDSQDGYASNLRISSYSSNVPTQNDAKNPYTISYKTKTGNTYQFTKVFDSTPTSANNTLTSSEKEKIASLGLQKLADCYSDYLGSIDRSWEGLHFMNAPISMDNLTTITATLSSSQIPIPDYQVPTNSIDFHLFDKGFINVLAGSYYNQRSNTGGASAANNSFFSIYKIDRYEDGKTIKSIKEICKIYAKMNGSEIDMSEDYYYTYIGHDNSGKRIEVDAEGKPIKFVTVDGEELLETHKDYKMVFDCHWITHSEEYNGWGTSRAYYFEVPVNKGEYAIGSTEGRTGAYLVYLDLAANAQLLDRTKDYEKIVENIAEASVPKGVEMLSTAEGTNFTPTSDPKPIDPLDSAFVSINGGSTGLVKVEKTDENTIKVTTETGITAEYISVNTVLTDKGGGVMSVPITQTTTIERTTYRDKNKTTGDLTVTVLTKTTVETKELNGTITKTEITYTKEVTVTDKDGKTVGTPTKDEITDLSKFVPDTTDPEGTKTATPGEDLINLAFAYGKDSGLQISYLYVPATSTTNADGTTTKTNATYLITIINPGEVDVVVKALLTAEGVSSEIDFIITDGTNSTTLSKTQDAQKVTITATADTPADEPSGEPSDELTE